MSVSSEDVSSAVCHQFKIRKSNFLSDEYWGLYEDQKIKLGLIENTKYIHSIEVDGIQIPITNNNGIYRIDVGNYSIDFTRKILKTLEEKIKDEKLHRTT